MILHKHKKIALERNRIVNEKIRAERSALAFILDVYNISGRTDEFEWRWREATLNWNEATQTSNGITTACSTATILTNRQYAYC